MFFKDDHGNCFPITRIRKIRPGQERQGYHGIQKYYPVDLDNNELIYITEFEREQLSRYPSSMIPNLRENYILSFVDDDAAPYKVEILGWAMTESGVLPVTVEGINMDADRDYHILTANGLVVEPAGAWHDNLDDYKKSQRGGQ